ncbi:unnamed protein product [Paramecium sonneborni]|uniref:Transmembrane protein n=1 Tax=Paramecium sonneborni TaxID=65129 RepID=A0A8S1K599_9CILI|nr:unnamed protein product [Paramecium sonneborni]
MQNNYCLFCEKQRLEGTIHYPSLLQTALYLKYNPQDEMTIDDLIKHSHKKWVIDFYEKSSEIKDEEFLNKYYNNHEITSKLIDLTEYYKYRLDIPNLFMLPLSKMMKTYNKLRKEYHYTKIKYKLKILIPENSNQVDVQFTQLLQLTMSKREEEQQSLISLLNKFQSQQNSKPKQIKSYTQQSSLSITKSYSKPLNKQNEQATKKLKSILNGDIRQPQQLQIQKKTQSKSHPNLKFNTLHSVYNTSKKLSIQPSKSNLQPIKTLGQSKIASQADIISNIYLEKSNPIKINLNILQMILLFALYLLSVQAIYILHSKGISIDRYDYFVIELNQIDYKVKSQIAHNGSFTISKLYNDSALYDVFILDQLVILSIYRLIIIVLGKQNAFSCLIQVKQAQIIINIRNNILYQMQQDILLLITHHSLKMVLFLLLGYICNQIIYQVIEPIPTYYQVTIKSISSNKNNSNYCFCRSLDMFQDMVFDLNFKVSQRNLTQGIHRKKQIKQYLVTKKVLQMINHFKYILHFSFIKNLLHHYQTQYL